MTAAAIAFAALAAVLLLALPRRWAPLPLLACACYMTVGQRIEVGPFTFTVLRILILIGVARAVVRGENLGNRWNKLDSLMAAFGVWTCVSSVFHQDPTAALVTHLGIAYQTCGIYFLVRAFCVSLDDVVRVIGITALVLTPVAAEMVYEQMTFHNLFSLLGSVPPTPQFRDGRIRAFGPFGHPILAGTVGGVTLPMMLGIWRHRKISASIGITACTTMIIASASSGPLVSAVIGVAGVAAWRFRRFTRAFRWSLLAGYAALFVVMERPPYYIIQRMEVVGGSTGWYRARLIETSLEHLGEWWLAGTDRTRHWMFQNAINENHIDITNQYLVWGVLGGLPLMLLHIAMLVVAFSIVGRVVANDAAGARTHRFLVWSLGCSLLAHTITGISVSYFDQSFLFMYLTLATIGASALALHAEAAPMVVAQNAEAPTVPIGALRYRRRMPPAAARVHRMAGGLHHPK